MPFRPGRVPGRRVGSSVSSRHPLEGRLRSSASTVASSPVSNPNHSSAIDRVMSSSSASPPVARIGTFSQFLCRDDHPIAAVKRRQCANVPPSPLDSADSMDDNVCSSPPSLVESDQHSEPGDDELRDFIVATVADVDKHQQHSAVVPTAPAETVDDSAVEEMFVISHHCHCASFATRNLRRLTFEPHFVVILIVHAQNS